MWESVERVEFCENRGTHIENVQGFITMGEMLMKLIGKVQICMEVGEQVRIVNENQWKCINLLWEFENVYEILMKVHGHV